MGASKPMDDLRTKAAGMIRSRLDRLTVSQAAIDLGVSRQAIYDIKKDKYCPSLSLIQRACEVWHLKFAFRGMLIEKSVFPTKTANNPPEPTQLELNLVEVLRHIDYRHFEVIEAKPVGRSIEIKLRLTIPA
ncbi:MAG: hypothetical protein QOJ99_830 [Bryobacterales bacterium]|jgi:DNA-binding XRE family transcriptional regulator|nr:hypothetical protein [Bryobacterales bacterium]